MAEMSRQSEMGILSPQHRNFSVEEAEVGRAKP